MALGSLSLAEGNVGFDAEGTAMVPVSSGKSTLGEIKIKSPLENLKDTFSDMRNSLASMVGIQTEEAKRQASIDEKLLAQKDFEIEMQNKEFTDSGAAGPLRPTSNDDLEGVDTDDKTYGNFVEKAETAGGNILDSIKDAFDQTSFGEKMMAVILAGGFLLFSKYSDTIQKYLEPIVQFVMDIIDLLGPEGAFFAFLGGFVLLKSGLAKKGLMKAGGFILKTIKASAASLDRQGGLFKAMGNGFERINKGAKGLVGQLGKMGKMITGGLTKGFTMLGRGLTALRLGVMSMYSSLLPMIAPFLPIIAIAAAVVAVFFSLKSGFDTFKQSLENGDSMLVAIGKGIADFALTLITLPLTLIKKLLGFIAGLFGFDGIKEALDKFSFKDFIKNSFMGFVTGFLRLIKAIAKGAVAALKALAPGGEKPGEAFQRVYNEVMQGGEGKSKTEKADEAAGIDTGDGSIAERIGKERNAKIKAKAKFMDKESDFIYEDEDSYYARSIRNRGEKGIEKHLDRRAKTADMMFEMNEADKLAYSKQYDNMGQPIVFNNTSPTTYNQKSETNVTGEIATEHSDRTSRAIDDAMSA